jgi:hypothetical protein
MWLLIILTLVNAAANNKTFVLEYRFSLAGMPINVFDVLVAAATVFLLIKPRARHAYAERIHPALWWILCLFAAGGALGLFGTLDNGAIRYDILNVTRNYISLPLTIILGYGLLPTQTSAKRFLNVQILAGIITALMILLFFRGQIGMVNDLNLLRTVEYISAYAGVAAVFLLFTSVWDLKIMPGVLGLIISLFCLIGQFATISRSEWISTFAALAAVIFLLPRGERIRRAAQLLGALPLFLLALFVCVQFVAQSGRSEFSGEIVAKL